MAGAEVGLGVLTFGTVLVGVFDAATGITIGNASVPEIDTQTDADTDITWCAGDSKDHQQVNASVQVAASVDVSALVGTTETLTYTYPSGDSRVGQAFLVSAPESPTRNDKLLAAMTFRWEDAPTFTPAP